MAAFLKNTILPVSLFLLALFTRLYKLDQITPGYLGDEVPIAQSAEYVFSHSYTPFYGVHPTLPLYLIGSTMNLFGRNLIGIRLSVVIFGALTLPLFFLICRRFFSATTSLLTSLILNFSYSHILTSRFANEVAPAVFFQTLSYLFLILAVQTRSLKYLLALSISLSLGLHTYLTFQSQAALITLLALILYPHKKHFLAFFTLLLIILSPLIIYEIRRPGSLWSRARDISVFHQLHSISDILTEVSASSFNIVRGFIIRGDPDPRQNPARSALYDPMTVTLAVIGLLILYRKNRKFFFLAISLGLPIFLNDALTVEIIPDFRIPGQSHPNTFHLSGFIVPVHLAAAFTLEKLHLLRLLPHFKTSLIASLIAIISFYNLDLYFGQTLEPYVYYFHNIRNQQITAALNRFSSPVHVSPSLIDPRITYFLTSPLTLIPISDTATPPAFIDIRTQPDLAVSYLDHPYTLINNPWGKPEILILPSP